MFARAVSFSILALPLLATAIALPGGGGGGSGSPSCAANTGALTCCKSTQSVTMSIDRNKVKPLKDLTG